MNRQSYCLYLPSQYYGTINSALNWRENEFSIYLQPGRNVGDKVSIVRLDTPPEVIIINELTTGVSGSGNNALLYLPPYGHIGYLRGTIALDIIPQNGNFSIRCSVPDSTLYVVNELKQAMEQRNISVLDQYKTEVIKTDRKTIYTHQSPTLDKIVYWFQQDSINFYGELLIKKIAQYTRICAVDDAFLYVLPYYCFTLHDIEKTAVATRDGSGLSPTNRITTLSIAKVLIGVQKEKWFDTFYNSMPIRNDLRVKGGSLRNTLSYAGYAKPQARNNNHTLVFSFIVNNYNGQSTTMRNKIWALLDELKTCSASSRIAHGSTIIVLGIYMSLTFSTENTLH
ncbi:unnamed protein product [Didymodactylos carnosus]|uniref:Uncharacterized protein n=1 Tax=Didymodactylos carnosus TaxID=1234261 RepID=A0A814VZ12_9BILA|nr:unnamed protein product [Didymodactylos carnosus]CAF1195203.1 unnamed protein product [Didymodactylos carnosus]CAF3959622.1 unnamed protein product [Didymodactylos carnosus]CAF3960302.1 unnamed protein product [Didymodactylos carnosus]